MEGGPDFERVECETQRVSASSALPHTNHADATTDAASRAATALTAAIATAIATTRTTAIAAAIAAAYALSLALNALDVGSTLHMSQLRDT